MVEITRNVASEFCNPDFHPIIRIGQLYDKKSMLIIQQHALRTFSLSGRLSFTLDPEGGNFLGDGSRRLEMC